MARAGRHAQEQGRLDARDPEVVYAEAAALLARYRAVRVRPDLAALGSTPCRRTSGTKAERTEPRLARHQRNT